MKKREFLAMGGAVPLMLAGCGGNGSGSAPVRLVNASVGYPLLGFMVESTQATTADVAYGATSPYENVEAGAVGITLTVGNQSATAAQVRTVNKDNRYSLVAYGVLNGLRLALVTESTIVPDAGKANVNVLNTSVDIGPVDVYLSAGKDLSAATLIASSIQASSTSPAQSAFAPILAGSYFVTVVGANSIAQGLSDIRFQTPAAITLTALQVLTIVLTPGGGGVLANAIMLTQGTTGTATSYLNSTARVRAVTAIPGPSISVVGATAAGTAVTVLAPSTTQQYSNYFVVGTGAPPVVMVGGAPVSVVMDDATGTTEVAGSLAAGGDYTLMVYLDASNAPKGKLIADDNTAPVTSSGLKFRLINLASDNQGLQLSMLVNKLSIASNITYATASKYKEISVPQGTSSTVQVNNGAQAIISDTSPLTLPNIFTEIVVSVPGTGNVLAFFSSASGTD
jgi:hypothetical protein